MRQSDPQSCYVCRAKCQPKEERDIIFGFPCDFCHRTICKICSELKAATEIRAITLQIRICIFWCPDCKDNNLFKLQDITPTSCETINQPQTTLRPSSSNAATKIENTYLKMLIKEIKDKNNILKSNKSLLELRIKTLESVLRASKASGVREKDLPPRKILKKTAVPTVNLGHEIQKSTVIPCNERAVASSSSSLPSTSKHRLDVSVSDPTEDISNDVEVQDLPQDLHKSNSAMYTTEPEAETQPEYTTPEPSPYISRIDHSQDQENAEVVIKQEEDISNADEFLSMQAEFELYCRLCLCVSQDSNHYLKIFPSQETFSARQEKIQQMLQDILPDLDLTLTYNPGICSDCEARLIEAYDFISLCTQNQDTLLNYKSKYVEGPFVNIQEVVEANNPVKKRKITVPSAIYKKQKRTLVIDNNEDVINESVSNLNSDSKMTIDNVEIKAEKDTDIYENSNKPFNSIVGTSEPRIFIQDYNISTKQADARQSLYETTSSSTVSLSEDTDNDVSANNTQQSNIKIPVIRSDASVVQNESVNVSDAPVSVKVENNTDIYENSNKLFNSIEGISEQHVFMHDYKISSKQVDARHS